MKIICLAKNYAPHAKEMNSAVPSEPAFFLKPDSAILQKKQPFFLPDFSEQVEYEAELVIRISKVGKCIEQRFANRYYDAVTLGIDFTARDLQKKAKEKGLPWATSKGFDQSAVLGTWIPVKDLEKNPQDLEFKFSQNGNIVQQTNVNDMVFPIDYLISYISQFMTLKIGDLIYTGTPKGVGPVAVGDLLEGWLEGQKVLHCRVK